MYASINEVYIAVRNIYLYAKSYKDNILLL